VRQDSGWCETMELIPVGSGDLFARFDLLAIEALALDPAMNAWKSSHEDDAKPNQRQGCD